MEAIEFKRMEDFRTKGTGKFYNEPQFYTVFFFLGALCLSFEEAYGFVT